MYIYSEVIISDVNSTACIITPGLLNQVHSCWLVNLPEHTTATHWFNLMCY